jgi:hypothetical protein
MKKGDRKKDKEKEEVGDSGSNGSESSKSRKMNKGGGEQKQDDDSTESQKTKRTAVKDRQEQNDESKGGDESVDSDKNKDKSTVKKSSKRTDDNDVRNQKQRVDEITNKRNQRNAKKSPDDEKTRLTEESSVASSSTHRMSMFRRALAGWAPLGQSMEDRGGADRSCLPQINDELMENMCFSRDECSWMCCRSERLGGMGYCIQSFTCIPMLCINRCACSCYQSCLLFVGECPCISYTKFGLHRQSPPRDLDELNDVRSFIKRHQERGHEDDICLIRVIGCDRPLLERVSVLHPMVRIHAVNIHTGQYLKRKKPDESHGDVEPHGCITTHESSTLISSGKTIDLNEDSMEVGLQYNQECNRLLPVSTTPFPLKRCMEPPRWQDGGGDLVINEPYETILDPETLLLVEICDFTSAGIASRKHVAGSESGYVGIAWGFLMPVSRSGRPCIGIRGGSINDEEMGATPRDKGSKYIPSNKSAYAEAERVNKRLTLQLFKWRQGIDPIAIAQARHRGILPLSPPATSQVPAVYLQWYLRNRKSYPVTLALRIGPISKPRIQRVDYRPTNCFQIERSSKTKDEHLMDVGEDDDVELTNVGDITDGIASKRITNAGKTNEALARRQWSKGNKCTLPKKLLVRKSLGGGGATALKYSHCGKWIAVATIGVGGKFPILIFDLDEEEGAAKQR